MTIPQGQRFQFTIPWGTDQFDTIAIWSGVVWEFTFTSKLHPGILDAEATNALENTAEAHLQETLSQAGWEMPIVSPTRIRINTAGEAKPPAEVLAGLAEEPLQTDAHQQTPTSHIRFQEGVLMQLWDIVEKCWRKGETPRLSTRQEWRPVEGQPAANESPATV